MFDAIEVFRDSKEDLVDLSLELEASLYETRYRKGQKKTYKVNTSNSTTEITSWKFNEYAYSHNVKLPIRARGVFLEGQRIAVRGYDKFFNINEVPATYMENLKKLQGPFEVATKENGCIVFISGLEDGTLVVCSKHVTGAPLEEAENSERIFKHSNMAQEAVYKQLAKKKKSPKDLAKVLYKHNMTAVAELCDDEFEEHLIEYPKELAGLYLHGLNANTIEFRTYPMEEVNKLADEFGFRKVHLEKFDTFEEMFSFLKEVGETGIFQDKEAEGFVIRSKDQENKTFFFKFKFEEPYALYRALREVTKTFISGKQSKVDIILLLRKYKDIIERYLDFVDPLFAACPDMKDGYMEEKGIALVRKLFLKKMGFKDTDGNGLIELAKNGGLSHHLMKFMEQTSVKYVIVPIAVVGCGKTTVFKTLSSVFPTWLHVQNDDFTNAKEFRTKCMTELKDKPVLLLDRNNFMKKERTEIIDHILSEKGAYVVPSSGLAFIGVNFTAAESPEAFSKKIRERVSARGDNHQSISAGSDSKQSEAVMIAMEARLQPPKPLDGDHLEEVMDGAKFESPDDKFAKVINVDITKMSSLEIAKKIWNAISDGKEFKETKSPLEEEWEKGFQEALSYKPTTRKKVTLRLKGKRPELYGIKIEEPERLLEIIGEKLLLLKTWNALKDNKRLQSSLHVTLAHKNSIHADQSLQEKWNDLGRLFLMQEVRKRSGDEKVVPVDFFCDVQVVKAVVFDGVLATAQVKISKCYPGDGGALKLPLVPLNEILHITLGTNKGVRPMELNIYLKELFTKHGEGLKDGDYALKTTTARVVNLEDVNLMRQQVYIHYSFDF